MLNITPKEIVNELNKYIIGQEQAKKTIAVALRNRWRRMRVNKNIKKEINPKNIIMIGPTGVGKTTIAKRLSKLLCSPFLKIEATKFTEIGYVGKEVESIIKDLAEISFKITKDKYINKFKFKINTIVENKIIDLIINNKDKLNNIYKNIDTNDKEIIKKKLRDGSIDNECIEINLNNSSSILGFEIISSKDSEDITNQLQSLLKNTHDKKTKLHKTKIKFAKKILIEEELNKFINIDEIKNKSIKFAEQNGIVFIDEIDKICKKKYEYSNTDVSREGVQRDLLPIVEGCVVKTKYGLLKTDNILFIASGSFESSKVSDLIPELQGRFPIKVELNNLTIKDFEDILIKTKISLIDQYIALFKSEGINIIFTSCGIKRISEISWEINDINENIGARRLYYVLEKIVEDISFYDFKNNEKKILINKDYVNMYLNNLIKKNNDNNFIL